MTSIEQELFHAIETDTLARVVEIIEDNPGLVNARKENGDSALLTAIYYNHKDIVELLITSGAMVNIWQAAALGDQARIEKYLHADTALLDAFSHDGFTPLQLAAFFGHVSLVEFLLNQGADPNVISRNETFARGVPILQSAVASGKIESARALIARGANVNIRNAQGMTPLHLAAFEGNEAMVRLLLDEGADIVARMDDGTTPREMAKQKGHDQIARMLIARCEG
jgi:ankyrin repeat protein